MSQTAPSAPDYDEARITSRKPIRNRRGAVIGEEIVDDRWRVWTRYNPGIASTMGTMTTTRGYTTNGTIRVPKKQTRWREAAE